MITRRGLKYIAGLALGAAALTPLHVAQAQTQAKPNVLMIVVDDMGYSDLGAFGGEIPTPNIDALVRSGVQLTNFHVAPTCSPTRSMLMSGTDNHLAGLGSMAEEILDEQKGHPGYEGYLNDRVMSLPEALRSAGYHTYMSGKWHLGAKEPQRPNARGFEKSFAMLNGGAHHFDQTGMIEALPKALYTSDDKLINLPADFTYTTDYFTKQIIDQIGSTTDAKPFFGYLAYTAPHWPLQAPDDAIALFKGKYDQGYEAVRKARLERMKTMGLIAPDTVANEAPDLWPHWNELTDQQRAVEARKMEVYAAMIHKVDENVGKLVSYLKSKGLYDNTAIIFFSDNGAEGGLPESVIGGKNGEWIARAFDNSFGNLGRKGSYFGYGPSWAAVSMTPFRMVKGYTYEGGIRSPAFISYPKWKTGEKSDQFVHVTDIAPTLLAIAGTQAPTERNGKPIDAPTGHSILPWLTGKANAARPSDEPVCTELFGRVSVWKDGWKLVHSNKPWGTGAYELFDMRTDPTERHDLSASQPTKLMELQEIWSGCQKRFGIYWNQGLAPQMVYGNETEYLFRPPHVTKAN